MRLLALLLASAIAACEEPPTEPPVVETPEAAPVEQAPRAPGPVPESWVEERVTEARERLHATEAGKRVWAALEAHGGLERWLAFGTVEFEFDYRPVGSPERRMHTFQELDLWSARGVHQELEGGAGADARFGWNGEQAWIVPAADAFPSSARFWTLTPYYFVGMPFVVADPGTRYESLGTSALDGRTQDVVKVTYEAGTGDSPGDYYILHLDSETHRMHALRYVVAYPGFFPEGGHTPEKWMRYALVEVQGPGGSVGLWMPRTLHTSSWNADTNAPGEVVTEIEVARIRFGQTYAPTAFDPPEGATVLEGL